MLDARSRTEHQPHSLFLFVPKDGRELGLLLMEDPELGGHAGRGTHPAAELSRNANIKEVEHVHEAQDFGDVGRLAQTGFEVVQAIRQFPSQAVGSGEFQLHRAHPSQSLFDEVVCRDDVARLAEVAGKIGLHTDAKNPGDRERHQRDQHHGHLPWPREAPIHGCLEQALDVSLSRRGPRIARSIAEDDDAGYEGRRNEEHQRRSQGEHDREIAYRHNRGDEQRSESGGGCKTGPEHRRPCGRHGPEQRVGDIRTFPLLAIPRGHLHHAGHPDDRDQRRKRRGHHAQMGFEQPEDRFRPNERDMDHR